MTSLINLLTPVAMFAVALMSFRLFTLRNGHGIALLLTPLLVGAFSFLVVEGLSVFRLLSASSISFVWIASACALAATVVLTRNKFAQPYTYRKMKLYIFSLSTPLRLLMAGTAGIWLILLLVAIVSPPNNWDSLTYHLPRILHWIQNSSVNYYEAVDTRQLMQPPLAEYGLLQLAWTTRSDTLLNLQQWSAGVWTLALVALIAKHLGLGRNVQVVAVALAGLLPIGIAEATTTQNEWLMTLWVACSGALFVLHAKRQTPYTIAIAATLALALCAASTKQFALIFIAPFVAATLLVGWRKNSIPQITLLSLSAVAGAAIALVPQAIRNSGYFGWPLGDPDLASEMATWTLGSSVPIVVNILTHAVFNVPIPSSLPLETIGNLILAPTGATAVDTLNNWGLGRFLPPPGIQLHEDSAASPVHALLGFSACLVLIVRKSPSLLRLFSLLVLVLFLFDLFAIRAWVGTNRYLMPAMIMACIPLAAWMARWGRWLTAIALSVCLAWGLFISLNLEYRPLVGPSSIFTVARNELYFAARPELWSKYRDIEGLGQAADNDGKDLTILICSEEDAWEYPIWVLSGAPWDRKVTVVLADSSKDAVLPNGNIRYFDARNTTRGIPGLLSAGETCAPD